MNPIESTKMNTSSRIYFGLLILLSLLAAGLFLYVTRNYGVGVSPDSVVFFSVAEQIQRGESLTISLFPPFYSAVLALISSVFAMVPLDAARVFGAIASSLTVFLSGIIFRRHLSGSIVFNLLAAFTVMIAYALVSIYITAWTEPLFIVLVLLYMIFMDSYLHSRKKVHLLLSAVSVALACITRYAGVAFIFIGLLTVLVAAKRAAIDKLVDLFLYGLISSIPIAALLLMNYLNTGTFAGARATSTFSYWDNFLATVKISLGWFLPQSMRSNWIWIAALLLVVGALVFNYFMQIRKTAKPDLRWQVPYIILIVGYILFIVASSKTSFTGLIDNRYMSVIYIPLLLLVFYYVYELLAKFGLMLGTRKAGILACVLIAAWVFYPLKATRTSVSSLMDMGLGYTNKFWRASETMQYLEQNLASCSVYSNGKDVIQFYTGRTVGYVPYRTSGIAVVADLAWVKEHWPKESQVCVVWFDQIYWRNYFFPPEDLMKVVNLQDEIKLSDGTIYIVNKIAQ